MKWRTVLLVSLSVICAAQLYKLGSIVFDKPNSAAETVRDMSYASGGKQAAAVP